MSEKTQFTHFNHFYVTLHSANFFFTVNLNADSQMKNSRNVYVRMFGVAVMQQALHSQYVRINIDDAADEVFFFDANKN